MPEFRAMLINNQIKPLEGYEEEYNKITPDTVINVKVTNPRSKPHLGLFFAAIKNAYDNWPENHEQQFVNSEHFRAWAECKCGYGMAIELSMDLMHKKGFFSAMTQVVNNAISNGTGSNRKYLFFSNTTTKIYVIYPRSISYASMGQDEFSDLSSKVSDLLKEHTGVSLDDYRMNIGTIA